MAVLASESLAILLALIPLWAIVVTLLCWAAVRRGAVFEAEVKAASFRLRFRTRPPGKDA